MAVVTSEGAPRETPIENILIIESAKSVGRAALFCWDNALMLAVRGQLSQLPNHFSEESEDAGYRVFFERGERESTLTCIEDEPYTGFMQTDIRIHRFSISAERSVGKGDDGRPYGVSETFAAGRGHKLSALNVFNCALKAALYIKSKNDQLS